jgi:transcriptional regulator with XRE-family HTH domain
MVTRIGNRRARRIFFRAWREKFHLTQEQIANRIGTTGATVHRIETAARDYTGRYLHAYAEALGIEPTDLYRPPERPSLDAKLRDADDDIVLRAHEMLEIILKTRKSG